MKWKKANALCIQGRIMPQSRKWISPTLKLDLQTNFALNDIELRHMWYALDLAVLAVGVMERTMTGERKSFHQVAFDHLKDLQNHLGAVNDIPRKIMMANVISSLLHMDDLSLNLARCASPWSYSESHYTCASEQTDLTHHALSDGVSKGGRPSIGVESVKC
ncbi:unnamed protein product [Prunus armeniaca]